MALKTCLVPLCFAVIVLYGWSSHAAVIFSTCPVPKTLQVVPSGSEKTQVETVDRFRPEEFRRVLRSYSRAFPQAINYVVWLLDHDPNARLQKDNDPISEEAGLFLEDLELVNALAAEEAICHDSRKLATQALAIFPFALRVNTEGGNLEYRVRYKVCEYYVDNERQLPIENACMVLGRETGYTFEELKVRIQYLDKHVAQSRSTIEAATMGVGLVAAVPFFKAARYLKAGAIVTIGATALPIAASYVAIERKWTDELIRNIIDFKDANEIAITGDLTTSVGVNMPMHDFIPYFQRYLDSMD